MEQRDRLIRSTETIMWIAWIANRVILVAIAVGLAATWLAPGFLGRLLAQADPAVNVPAATIGVRLLMLIGIAMAIATDRLLVPLAAIVASAGSGDPFMPVNARRLRAAGWALLTLQLLDIPCTLLARSWPSLGSAAPDGGISIGGWLATLMVFVLARVFAAGSIMRDEMEGTV